MSKTYQARDPGKEWGAAPGNWSRELMPRTALVFINEDRAKAREQAGKAIANYWKAVEGTLDPGKVAQAVDNALVGTPQEIVEQINQRFHEDDFNNHDNQAVKHSMRLFKEKCAPHAKGRLS
jgi:alkanesulfonate monooxygenase SsuD/methylene tetrahydromethanopterin reductase-like flavin-dependent oxidoreductase (luciferase family)